MNKRKFIKTAVIGSLSAYEILSLANTASTNKKVAEGFEGKRWWVWLNPDNKEAEAVVNARYALWKESGIDGIFFESDSEMHCLAAKRNGIAAHRWMWIMNRPDEALMKNHPGWYAVSRNGKSCITHPPYVGYYRWLCPNKAEVRNYLEAQVSETVSKHYFDGIHLDYIRYCDVVLPVNLWDHYKIKQNAELPEYDFCYCPTCRELYQQKHGTDPLMIEHPDQSPSWKRFRYNAINKLVNQLAETAREYGKPISAAVFPTPDIAKRIVRQDWANWNLDAVFPMIYHGFYKENVAWIGEAVQEGVAALHGKFPLYAGIFLPDFKGPKEIEEGMRHALNNKAAGVSIFGQITPDVLKIVKNIKGKS